jgi:N-acetylglutamate synthase-like GNAT family acetyltransferase
MQLADLSIRPLDSIASLVELSKDADADGCRMVSRLIDEWNDGTNRFDQPGEKIYCATVGGDIVGVCGLNRDPFAGVATIGRVRRLYVATAFRRRGVASALLRRLSVDARAHFSELHLRTYDPVASAFYESFGFSIVDGNPQCTQSLLLTCSDH